MKKSLLFFAMFFAIAFAAQSQNSDRPWLIGVSTNYADFHAVELPFGDQLTQANWMGMTLPSQLKIGRSLNKSFNLSAEFSWIKLEEDKMNEFLFIYHETETYNPITNSDLFRINLQAEYKFANGYLLKEDSWFDPYLLVGVNGSSIDDKANLGIPMGLGMNFWFVDWFGANIEGSYDYLFDYNDYFHYSLGLVFRFGKQADTDKDGITDKKDACPDIAGLPEFNGCPDTDKDGIMDKEDACPTVAGLKEFKGCPDSDGDGIIDKDDKCPKDKGLKEFGGCPDTDGDGITDKEDDCPTVKGPKELKGCPDTDGDGIVDKNDQCPNEKGVKENNGCPKKEAVVVVPPVEKQKEIEFAAKNILFDTGKSTIKAQSFPDLDNVVKIMNEFPESRFDISGHTDNTGNKDKNLKLSDDRAKAVKDYLVGKGIAANRLTAQGYGIEKPIATNDTPEGRQQNRRVEIKLVK